MIFSCEIRAGKMCLKVNELEEMLKEEGLLKAHIDGSIKEYVKGEVVYSNNEWHNCTDVFGIHKLEDGRYRIFITESERGMPRYSKVVATEEEACDLLVEKVRRAESIYQDKLKWYSS